ncbi:MAG: hypothetical protein ACRAVC_13025 [Trichormus sp.]
MGIGNWELDKGGKVDKVDKVEFLPNAPCPMPHAQLCRFYQLIFLP